MEEDHKHDQQAPPRYRYKLIKFVTLTLFFLVIFFSLGIFGLEATSGSKFCSSCHEMKPEYYTWKASTHSEVDCVNCHIEPGVKQIAKDKAEGLIKELRKEEGITAAIIRMPKEIPDSACEKCHTISTREFTPSGDIIIPHQQHSDKKITCTQCHSNVAHGKIADRNMTFKTDYDKWDSKVGQAAMADLKFTRPTMETCMDCHIARKITTECSACHTTGMIPKSHKKADFKIKNHGVMAKTDLQDCNSCHKYMSTAKLEGYEEASTIDKYLNTDSGQSNKDEHTYAKENTFCQDCHKTRPASHSKAFIGNHGTEASKNEQKCYTCHDPNKSNTASNNTVNCSTCHQMKHLKNWREGHPIPVDNVKRPEAMCYTCHVEKRCTSCHKN
ncbi:NapC/NirT cytochrome c domain protein [Neobacillus bataviensis LMG 21833]|uniref:NapC/NirT cytochrome c domain protein n=1 Tax=Neobacillus bataviensis LMG 21833 TaxID=1117379 RepID=K6DSN7_9BACI|nr:NapC/NirT family cytochrome c [Neobacillus bataviensis]EKN71369.1 NapC/NirT cytochrome c domain protein [Neobacillus bataviensis LMG 21833]